MNTDDDAWYSLDGRRLSGKPAQKGVLHSQRQKGGNTMKREAYIKPDCQQIPLNAESHLLEISSLTGTGGTLGKQTDYEEADGNLDSWEYDVENPFGTTYNARKVWKTSVTTVRKGRKEINDNLTIQETTAEVAPQSLLPPSSLGIGIKS